MADSDTLYGATITFSSGFMARIISASWSGISRGAIDITHTASTASGNNRAPMEFKPADVWDPGSLEVGLQFDKDTKPPVDANAETVTFTFDQEDDEATSAATWAASGFLTEFSWDAPDPGSSQMTASATVKFTGDITVNAAA